MTEKQKQIITRMRTQGAGYTAVAAATGLTKDCVRAWCRRHGMGGFAKKSAATETAPGVCRNCGEKFDIVPRRKPRKFCCDECRVEWWSSQPAIVRRRSVFHETKGPLKKYIYPKLPFSWKYGLFFCP